MERKVERQKTGLQDGKTDWWSDNRLMIRQLTDDQTVKETSARQKCRTGKKTDRQMFNTFDIRRRSRLARRRLCRPRLFRWTWVRLRDQTSKRKIRLQSSFPGWSTNGDNCWEPGGGVRMLHSYTYNVLNVNDFILHHSFIKRSVCAMRSTNNALLRNMALFSKSSSLVLFC